MFNEENNISNEILAKLSPGNYNYGGGLYLQIINNSEKNWLFRYTHNGANYSVEIGSVRVMKLDVARMRANKLRTFLVQGGDPSRLNVADFNMQPGSEKTFDDCMAEYIARRKRFWRSAKYARQWESGMRSYISPYFSDLTVREITTEHILDALGPIWLTRTETASRLRSRIEHVLAWATVSGYRKGSNPASWGGNLEELLPSPRRIKEVHHFPAIPYQNIKDFFVKLVGIRLNSHSSYKREIASALAFTILTACRTNETLRAQWDEIDFTKAIWTIPANRMKSKCEHRVPLSKPVLSILYDQKSKHKSGWLFRDMRFYADFKPLCSYAMLCLLQTMERKVTVHGFRSSFRIWAAEKTNYPREVSELALAHCVGSSVETAYMRSDLFERRRNLMRDWANWCMQLVQSESGVAKAANGLDVDHYAKKLLPPQYWRELRKV